MKDKFLIVILLFTYCLAGLAQNNTLTLFDEAVKSIDENKFDEALTQLNDIEQKGYVSYGLYYNKAVSYYNLGQKLEALYNFEKAAKFKAGSKEIKTQIEQLRSELEIDIFDVPDFILLRWIKSVSAWFGPGSWLVIEILSAIGVLLGIYFWKFGQARRQRRNAFMLSLAFLFVLLISIGLGQYADKQRNRTDIYLSMKEMVLYESADDRSGEIKTLPAGAKLWVLDSVTDWKKIQLRNKEIGWVKSNGLAQI